ncbi:MAG: hypothetical protein ACRDNP_07965, partial [Gaiellaceae bacterium]
DWRVEHVVDAVAQHFEHFLAWTIGVVIELVNQRLAEASIAAPLCEALPSYVRYGVDSPLALRLVVSGVRSRRLAHVIAAATAAEEVEGDSLRQWLGSMEIAELRRRFTASSSELLDLLEFARTPRASVLRDLLEQGRSVIEVHLIDRTDEAEITTSPDEDHAAAEGTTVREAEGEIPVDLRPVVGEERPPRLGVFSAETDDLVALVPTPSYGDVQSILDTGVPTTGTLRGETLELVLAPETAT